jgi:hypothetical protein
MDAPLRRTASFAHTEPEASRGVRFGERATPMTTLREPTAPTARTSGPPASRPMAGRIPPPSGDQGRDRRPEAGALMKRAPMLRGLDLPADGPEERGHLASNRGHDDGKLLAAYLSVLGCRRRFPPRRRSSRVERRLGTESGHVAIRADTDTQADRLSDKRRWRRRRVDAASWRSRPCAGR